LGHGLSSAGRDDPATVDDIVNAQAVLSLICTNRDREARADLAVIIQKGFGDRPITELNSSARREGRSRFIPT
jgi:hypothetical protein